MKIIVVMIVFYLTQIFGQVNNILSTHSEIINIGSRLELFTDYYLIDALNNTELRLHHPVDKGTVLEFGNPWEGPFFAYCTVIDNGKKLQLFYRGLPTAGKDGIHWLKPELGIFEVNGTKHNNVILANAVSVTHNFSPFLDTRKDINPNYKYKALGGTQKSGLIAYVSEDGIHWNKLQESPVFSDGVFDSQNISQ